MPEKEEKMYAVVRIRGSASMTMKSKDVMRKLRLKRTNNCVLVPADGTHKGMLNYARNYVTWGEITQETLLRMLEKKGQTKTGEKIDTKKAKTIAAKILHEKSLEKSGIRPVIRLAPPSGGLRSIKLPYPMGDAGNRGEKINELIVRMI